MRFTNTIYLVSGIDGTILWRLGGSESDFDQDFTFSKQHHAKFLESNRTHHVISFLNNASDDQENEELVSSALIVELETGVSPKKARVIGRYSRPDDELTRLRGNVQRLPNGNIFVGWSDGGYHSEFSSEGDVLMEARFLASEFSTYRAYKFEFIGRPETPPALMASATEDWEHGLHTTIYVSWNGATDVASWNFYAQGGEDHQRFLLGTAKKTEFETRFTVPRYFDWISAEPVDRDGNALGRSRVHRTATPSHWDKLEDYETATPQHDIAHGVGEFGKTTGSDHGSKTFPMLILVFGASGALLIGIYWWARTGRMRSFKHVYQRVPASETGGTELLEFNLDPSSGLTLNR
jgi:hypothetical protein